MTEKTRCGDCEYYAPARNPKTNRPLPSQKGECIYPVVWPTLPKSFEVFFPDREVRLPHRSGVWPCDVAPCPVFSAPKPAMKLRKHAQVQTEIAL